MVSGPEGIGKTTLTLHWAHRHRDRFPGGQLHVDFAAEPDQDTAVVLERLLRNLGVETHALPPDLGERVALWRR